MKRRKAVSLERKRARYGYLFSLPFILGVGLLFLPNIVKTFMFSINEVVIGSTGYSLQSAGFQYYYKAFFEDAKFIQYVLTSLGELIVDVPIILIFSLFTAMVLNQEFKGRVVARAIFFLPVVLSTGIIASVDANSGMTSLMSTRDALEMESAASFWNLTQVLTSMNFNETLTDIVVGAANGVGEIANASGMQIFIFLAAFQQIPGSVYEAAQVEGCSKWLLFWKIVIPMTSKQIIVAGVYTVIDVFTRTDSTLFTYIHSMAYANNQYSYAMAMYVIYALSLAVMMGITLVTIYQLMKKSDGVKGNDKKKKK